MKPILVNTTAVMENLLGFGFMQGLTSRLQTGFIIVDIAIMFLVMYFTKNTDFIENKLVDLRIWLFPINKKCVRQISALDNQEILINMIAETTVPADMNNGIIYNGYDDVSNKVIIFPLYSYIFNDVNVSFKKYNTIEKEEHGREIKKSVTTVTLTADNNVQIEDFFETVRTRYQNIIKEREFKVLKDKKKGTRPCFIITQDKHAIGDKIIFKKVIDFTPDRTFKTIFFNEKINTMKILEQFQNRIGVYSKKYERPWKLGIFLHGPPGTGKTSFIRALCNYTRRSVFFMRIADMTDVFLQNIFINDKILYCSRSGSYQYEKVPFDDRIYVFEDVDTGNDALKCRKLIKKEYDDRLKLKDELKTTSYVIDKSNTTSLNSDSLNSIPKLTTFLNGIDGIVIPSGLICVLTTNNPEKIDEAVKRPGRMDINIELGYATPKIASDIMSRFYDKKIMVDKINEDITPAEVENMCLKYNSDEVIEKLSSYVKI